MSTPPKDATAFEPGHMLKHYRLAERLGAGGMGEVWRAEDTRLGRSVALKRLPKALAADPEWLERFRREARTLAALNHPHIVTIHSVEDADGDPFLAMELVRGHTLTEEMARGALPAARVLDIAIPIAEALAVAHASGNRAPRPQARQRDARRRTAASSCSTSVSRR
jgi:serine/threonine protein kinase